MSHKELARRETPQDTLHCTVSAREIRVRLQSIFLTAIVVALVRGDYE
jgi:hypothetical protein